MAKTIYIDSDPDTGSDTNPGIQHKRPKRTIAAALASAQAGYTLSLRDGRLYDLGDIGLVLKTPKITLTSYSMGGETSSAPMLRLNRGKGTLLTLAAPECHLKDVALWEADTCVEVTAEGCTLTDVHTHKFGFGIVVKASHTTIKDPAFFQGRMKSNTGAKSDAGAQAITLWKVSGVPHTGTRITGAYGENIFASSLAFGVDGALIEIWGAIEDAEIRDCVGRNLATFMEVGGPKGGGGAVSNVRVIGCFAENTNGRVLFVNSPDEGFYVDWYRFFFEDCTFIADDDEASPFYVAGPHGSLKDRLAVKRSIIQATSQIYNAGTGTDLNSLVHEKNVYYRPDGGTGIGVPLVNGDMFGNPHFNNAPAHDYRLTPNNPLAGKVGAFGAALTRESEIVARDFMRRPSPETPYPVNRLQGGPHAVPRWQDMTAISMAYRVAGMRCTVLQHRMTYELQEDKLTWLKVR